MILNVIRNAIGVIAPLITFPYVARVLSVENMGGVAFAGSVIAYFVLIADLGVKMYTIGRGPAIRNNPDAINQFASSVFSINVLSTLVSYLLLFPIIWFVPQFHINIVLLLLFSFQIISSTIGVDWVFTIYEDFFYITIRTLVVRVLFIILVFLFVKDNSDFILYVVLIVVPEVCISVFNFIYAKRYCKIRLTSNLELNKHLKPILILFFTQATIVIYVSSDTTILGLMCDSTDVGIYTVSSRIYGILKGVVAAIVAASIPRMGATFGSKNGDFEKVGSSTYTTMCTMVIPLIVGTIVLAPEIVSLIAGNNYADSVLSVRILAVSLFFCIGAYFWGQAVLVPVGKEKILFKATLISGSLNVILNIILIPVWTYNAAALTTLMSEAFTFFYCRFKSKEFLQLQNEYQIIFKCIIGCIGIVITAFIFLKLELPILVSVPIIVLLSTIVYGLTEYLLKNSVVVNTFNQVLCPLYKRLNK